MAGKSSKTTHKALKCVDACKLLARMMVKGSCRPEQRRNTPGGQGLFSGKPKNYSHCQGRIPGKG